MDQGRFSPDDTKIILTQVLRSLADAHARGLIHRDLKPSNVRVFEGQEGPLTVKVLDFGIARSTDAGHPSLTATGDLIGTPRYMAPEQLAGQPLTAASDVYTAGLLGYELLGGRDVLGGNSLGEQLDRCRPDYVFDLAGADAETQELLTVLRRFLRPEPTERPGNAAAALRILEGGDAPDGPTTAAPPANRKAALILAGILAAVVAVAVFMANEPEPAPTALPQPRENPLQTLPEPAPEPQPEAEAEAVTTCRPPFEGRADVGTRHPGGLLHYVPVTGPEIRAVVLLLAPAAETEAFYDYTKFHDVAERERFAVVVPDAQRPADAGTWYADARAEAWAAQEAVRETYCINKDAPLFLVGEAIGGVTVDRLTLQHRDKVRAIAVASQRYHDAKAAPGKATKSGLSTALGRLDQFSVSFEPIDRIDLTATVDDISKDGGANDGRGNYFSLARRHDRLREAHDCSSKSEVRRVSHGTCEAFDCEVALTLCEPDARYWSGGAPWATNTAHAKFEYAEVIWAFFAERLPK